MARARYTIGDIGRSMGLMAVVVVALLFIGPARALVMPGSDRMAPVDYTDVARGFRTVTHLEPPLPIGLPASWRANAARLARATGSVGTRLHIGWAVPGSRFAGLDESDRTPGRLTRSVLGTRGGTVHGTRTVGGVAWQVRVSDLGEPAYTRAFGGVFVVVTGSATDTQLMLLLASLR
jgi:hypothetical protein